MSYTKKSHLRAVFPLHPGTLNAATSVLRFDLIIKMRLGVIGHIISVVEKLRQEDFIPGQNLFYKKQKTLRLGDGNTRL